MEFTVYLDSSMKNVQIVRSRTFDVIVKPAELAGACHTNWYAVSKDGGALQRNPEYQHEKMKLRNAPKKMEASV